MTPAIRLAQVTKRFAGRVAVDDVSLEVPRGGIYGLLGHNGAGKSTTLGMLLGQVFPDTGEVEVNGHNVFADRRGALGQVGSFFESPCFYEYLSGRRNLEAFSSYTCRLNRQAIDEVVELVGLSARIKDKVGVYSHGMRQRLALAQALLPQPELIILDEPTDGLDPKGIAELRQTLRTLNEQRGITILFSSHLLSEVEQLCDRLAVLHRGKLIFEGCWEEAGQDAAWLDLDVDRREQAMSDLRAAGLLQAGSPADRLQLTDSVSSADVNHWLVEHGYRVSRLALERPTLEDFYMQTVGDDPFATST